MSPLKLYSHFFDSVLSSITMGNNSSTAKSPDETQTIMLPDDGNDQSAKRRADDPHKNYQSIQETAGDDHHVYKVIDHVETGDIDSVTKEPQVPPVKGRGCCATCYVSTSHRICTLIVGVALGLLLAGFNLNLTHVLEKSKASDLVMLFMTILSIFASVALVFGGLVGCLLAQKITWWKALAPGLLVQATLLLYYFSTPHVHVLHEVQSHVDLP